MMAMSLIGGESSIPDLYLLVDKSVPEIPSETLDRANPETARGRSEPAEPASGADHDKESASATERTETNIQQLHTPPETIDAAVQEHLEQSQSCQKPLDSGFHQASAALRPVCLAWMDRVKRNATAVLTNQPLEPEASVEEIEKIGYTPTESAEPFPPSVCTDILKLLDNPDPLPDRGHDMLEMDWEPVLKIFYTALPAFWGLFASTSAFDSVKLYLDDVARVFHLPTLVTKYGTENYLAMRAMQSFGMCLGLVCHPMLSAEILEMAVKGFDKLGLKLHHHTMETMYQLVQTLPFANKGQYGTRMAQNYLQRCQIKYGQRHGRTISALALIARGLVSQNQKTFAQGLLKQVARMTDAIHESDKTSKQYADALRDIGKAEFYAGLNHNATKTLTDALSRNDDLEHRAPDSSHLSFLVGMMYGQMHQWEHAITFLRRSTMYRSDTFGELHRATGSSMEALSVVWERRGVVLYDNPVLELLEKLVKHYQNRFGGDHQRTWDAWVKFGTAMMEKKSSEHKMRVFEEEFEFQ
ncbi:hypothetical protein TWF694_009083 [Orbilia ellipsospora]